MGKTKEPSGLAKTNNGVEVTYLKLLNTFWLKASK